MKINDEGTSNAAHWHERAMKAEARIKPLEETVAAQYAHNVLLEVRLAELVAMLRANPNVYASEILDAFLSPANSAPAAYTYCEHRERKVGTDCPECSAPGEKHEAP